MDSSYTYFAAAPPFYQSMGLPPTPAHTAPNSEDYNNPSPDGFDFHAFDPYNSHNFTSVSNTHEVSQKPPTPVSVHKNSIDSAVQPLDNTGGVNDGEFRRGQSNSDDEENMTPALTRRKAQNRAAQRAFRERKERHVKDLETKLAELEKNSADVAQENERLRLQLQKAATENEILKATSSHAHGSGAAVLPTPGPLHYSPTDFYTEVLQAHDNKTPSHRITTSASGERLLAAGATWDYIISHPLYRAGRVDVGIVSDRLKLLAKCDGQGPVFEEKAILNAIEHSVASGSDELL